MNKSISLAVFSILAAVLILFSCGSDSSDDSSGYSDPGDFEEKTVYDKSINIDLGSGTMTCSAKSCLAIIFQQKISGTKYVGIAVKDATYKVRIHWHAGSISSGTHTYYSTIIINESDGTEARTSANVEYDITNNSDGTYTVVINTTPIVVGTYSMTTFDVTAAYY